MKYLFSLIAVLFISIHIDAQSETRTLDDYDSVKVSGGISVVIHSGSPKAEIDIKKGSLDKLVTEVKDKTLTISFKGNSWFSTGSSGSAHIDLYGAQEIKELKSSAGSDVSSEITIATDDFDLKVSSGANVELMVDCDEVDASVSSGAHVELSGKTRELDVSASSGASFRSLKLESKEVDASANSGGSVKVWVVDKLEASAGSGGSVKYKGEPSEKDINVGKYSGGSVSKI